MAYSWLFLVLILCLWGYYLGRVCADHGKTPQFCGIAVGVLLTTFFLAIGHYPEYEYYLMGWKSYAYLRDGIALPWIFMLLGAIKAHVLRREAYPLRVLLFILVSITVYNYRWGLGMMDYSTLVGQRDEYGICLNTYPDTRTAAAAATLLNYLGFPVSEGAMARASLTRSRGGADIMGLVNALRRTLSGTECKVKVVKLTYEELLKNPAPAIVYLNEPQGDMWPFATYEPLVFFGREENGISLGSPRKGLITIRTDDFANLWNGIAVIIERPSYIVPGKSFSTWT